MKETIYIVNTNLEGGVKEQEIIRRTDSYYWVSENDRRATKSRYYIVYFDKQKAIDGLKGLIRNQINLAESTIKYYTEKLNQTNQIYGN
jgi:RNA binding exosome subunit